MTDHTALNGLIADLTNRAGRLLPALAGFNPVERWVGFRPAIAGGTELLQGTDIRIAGESAKFGISEAKWSLYPMGGSAVRLVRQIPYTIACDLLLTGRHITASEAMDYGLIGYVVPDGTALDKALEIAEVINNNGPLAVQAILRSIHDTAVCGEISYSASRTPATSWRAGASSSAARPPSC